MNIRISVQREIPDVRLETALKNPKRRDSITPLAQSVECPLGRLFAAKKITEAEYNSGCLWRKVYLDRLHCIGAPNPFSRAIDYSGDLMIDDILEDSFSEEEAEVVMRTYRAGEKILKSLGNRVFHAVNAIAVYEEPEELGDFEYTAKAAKIGLAALSRSFG